MQGECEQTLDDSRVCENKTHVNTIIAVAMATLYICNQWQPASGNEDVF